MVLHVLQSGDRNANAIARTVEGIVNTTHPHRYRFSVLFVNDDGVLGDRFRSSGVHVKSAGWSGELRDAVGAARFAGALRQLHPAVIHFHAGGASVRFIARWATDAKIVAHFHSLRNESGTGGPRSTGGADMVLANSGATAKTLKSAKPVVVHPGVALDSRVARRTPSAGQSVKLGIAVRLVRVKGVDVLLEAMSILVSKDADVVLEIAGAGPERKRLERISSEAGLNDRVRFLGWSDDVVSLMANWDIYVQPSLEEGLGLSVLEAMAAGIPVVAGNTGGLPEVVTDGVTGILVEPGSATELADAIAALVRHPETRSSMGDAGRTIVAEQFTLERASSAVCAEYDRLLA